MRVNDRLHPSNGQTNGSEGEFRGNIVAVEMGDAARLDPHDVTSTSGSFGFGVSIKSFSAEITGGVLGVAGAAGCDKGVLHGDDLTAVGGGDSGLMGGDLRSCRSGVCIVDIG